MRDTTEKPRCKGTLCSICVAACKHTRCSNSSERWLIESHSYRSSVFLYEAKHIVFFKKFCIIPCCWSKKNKNLKKKTRFNLVFWLRSILVHLLAYKCILLLNYLFFKFLPDLHKCYRCGLHLATQMFATAKKQSQIPVIIALIKLTLKMENLSFFNRKLINSHLN